MEAEGICSLCWMCVRSSVCLSKAEEGSYQNRCFLLGRETKFFSVSFQSCGVFKVFSIEYPVVFLECFQLSILWCF